MADGDREPPDRVGTLIEGEAPRRQIDVGPAVARRHADLVCRDPAAGLVGALGLSAYSEVLDQFGTGDGQIALHGTNHSSELGRAITHGCVRLSNASISKLAAELPPGSPVDIHA